MSHEADCPYCGALAVKPPGRPNQGLLWQLPRTSKLAALEARLSKLEEAAIEAEKMFDVMAIEGIKDWLVPPYRQLYAEVHTDLRAALKKDEGAIPW